MEATRAEKTRLGLFVLLVIAAFLISMAFLVGHKLTVKTDPYFARLSESVTGLELGSPVKQNGVDIGQVISITTDSSDVQKAVIHIQVARGTAMKTDMVAALGSYGITGLKYLEITGGSYGSADIPKGGEVRTSLSMLGRLSQRADSIAYKIDRLLGNVISITEAGNRKHLDRLFDASVSLAVSLDSLARDLQNVRPGKRVEHILAGADAAMGDLRGQIHAADLDGTLREYRGAAKDIQKVAQSLDVTVRRTQEDMATALANLKETLKNMNAFSRQIKDNPSVLLRGEDKEERHP